MPLLAKKITMNQHDFSHTLRTPLTGILGFADILQKETLTQKQSHCVINILQASQEILQFVETLERKTRTAINKKNLSKNNSKITKKICSILLVEDHPIIQRVHRIMLESLGYQVDVAENGAKALKLFNKKHRLVLLDIGLPDKSGVGVAIEIRRQEAKTNRKPIPIIVATAFAHDELQDECKQAGVNEFLTKPLSQEKLSQVINRWLTQ